MCITAAGTQIIIKAHAAQQKYWPIVCLSVFVASFFSEYSPYKNPYPLANVDNAGRKLPKVFSLNVRQEEHFNFFLTTMMMPLQ